MRLLSIMRFSLKEDGDCKKNILKVKLVLTQTKKGVSQLTFDFCLPTSLVPSYHKERSRKTKR